MAFHTRAITMHTMDDLLPRWEPVADYLRRFQHDFCTPAMPPLRIQQATDRTWTDAEYRDRRPTGFPARTRGVYLLFAADERLLYIGLAMYCFDKRIWSHDGWSARRFIDIIAFRDQWLVLAPALEFYLITALNPPDNTVYRNYVSEPDAHAPIPSCPKSPSG